MDKVLEIKLIKALSYYSEWCYGKIAWKLVVPHTKNEAG
jgi:hypothetical protein